MKFLKMEEKYLPDIHPGTKLQPNPIIFEVGSSKVFRTYTQTLSDSSSIEVENHTDLVKPS